MGVQQIMVQKISKGAGITVETEICTAGHSPFLSQSETILRLIGKAIV